MHTFTYIIFFALNLHLFRSYTNGFNKNGNNLVHSREKRTLIWKEGLSRLQIITGFGVPVDLKVETVIIGSVIKGNYKLPMNASDYTGNPSIINERRKKRSISRWDMYDTLAQLFQMRGFGGKDCILRTICEFASTPIEKNDGLFGELLHAVFDPKSTKEMVRHHGDNEYYAAQSFGKKFGESCKVKFGDCTNGLMEMFTM